MIKLTLVLLILSLGLSVIAQNSWDVYKNRYGIPEITPTKTIKSNSRGGYDVFNNTYGIPEITPSKTIRPDNREGMIFTIQGMAFRNFPRQRQSGRILVEAMIFITPSKASRKSPRTKL